MLQWEGREDADSASSESGDSADEQAGNAGTTEGDGLSLDDAFDILSNQRRRSVLRYLLETDPEGVELGHIAEHIAALENDKEIAAVTSNERKRVYVGLYQNHLPRMDAVDVVEFDSDRKTIYLGDHGAELETYLHVDSQGTSSGKRWALFNLAVAACGALLLLASLPASSILSQYQPLLVAGLVTCFAVLSIAQLYTTA